MCFNIGTISCSSHDERTPLTVCAGVIVGPVLGGLLADPVTNYPGVFGKNSTLGGQDGVWWLQYWPYALPNIISAIFLLGSALAVIFGLEEVRISRHHFFTGTRELTKPSKNRHSKRSVTESISAYELLTLLPMFSVERWADRDATMDIQLCTPPRMDFPIRNLLCRCLQAPTPLKCPNPLAHTPYNP